MRRKKICPSTQPRVDYIRMVYGNEVARIAEQFFKDEFVSIAYPNMIFNIDNECGLWNFISLRYNMSPVNKLMTIN
jgi:hypothetical protein